ncbi:DNA-binding transcriptional regulator, MarR family [Oscillibacter sp. PC13]|uniref:MarR family winged helix-turn-helix transcriptional regulator n=1 Tax=Oscillibacter sp. PC13 TaxID=1855299 RepID=UPI0008E9FC7F|nr:helix-turn-helix domain-containing protein [Oscillibacter sp. PC13]SFP76645.1 DNA-binding transcriptional regulator, MarR family [Oscillibacter sp. PC13]
MHIRQQMEIINTCNCRITELYGEWAKQHGMSYHAMITLYALNQDRKCTQKQIAEEWLIPKQTVNTVVKDLERRGYLCFEPGRDQKEKLVCFTPQGKLYAAEVLEELYQMEDRVMERMGAALCQALVDSNAAFAQALADEVSHGA